jgi:hypothetical protein
MKTKLNFNDNLTGQGNTKRANIQTTQQHTKHTCEGTQKVTAFDRP